MKREVVIGSALLIGCSFLWFLKGADATGAEDQARNSKVPPASGKLAELAAERDAKRKAGQGSARKETVKFANLSALQGSERLQYLSDRVLPNLEKGDWPAILDQLKELNAAGIACDDEWRLVITKFSEKDSLGTLELLRERGEFSRLAIPMKYYAKESPRDAVKWFESLDKPAAGVAESMVKGVAEGDLLYAEQLLKEKKGLMNYRSFNAYFDSSIESRGIGEATADLMKKLDAKDPLATSHPRGALGNIMASKLIKQAAATGDYGNLKEFYSEASSRNGFLDDHTVAMIADSTQKGDPDFALEILEPRVAQCKDDKLKPHLEKLLKQIEEKLGE